MANEEVKKIVFDTIKTAQREAGDGFEGLTANEITTKCQHGQISHSELREEVGKAIEELEEADGCISGEQKEENGHHTIRYKIRKA